MSRVKVRKLNPALTSRSPEICSPEGPNAQRSGDTNELRLSPLALAKKEGRGRLKIFLGAAPGVGKTYAMLGAGVRAEKMGGVTLSPVLVETHGLW